MGKAIPVGLHILYSGNGYVESIPTYKYTHVRHSMSKQMFFQIYLLTLTLGIAHATSCFFPLTGAFGFAKQETKLFPFAAFP